MNKKGQDFSWGTVIKWVIFIVLVAVIGTGLYYLTINFDKVSEVLPFI